VARGTGRRRRGLVDLRGHAGAPFRELRLSSARLPLRGTATGGATIVVTSVERGDGRSTVALNYARAAAEEGLRVLLIDADLGKPALHRLLDVPPGREGEGLVGLLSMNGSLSLDEAAFRVGDRLDVVTAGESAAANSSASGSPAMALLLQHARARYDLVVVDGPPLLVSPEAAALASHEGNEVIVVVRPTVKRRALKDALRKLELVRANVLGLVVNKL
jgi:polysaccharide biosynthesis transport protein